MTAAQKWDDAEYRAQSFWHASLPGTLNPRPSLAGNHSTDITIIGGGYTGLWTAYYLNRHAPHLSITLLEARIAGFGAAGRNGGWCSGFLDGIHHWLDDPGRLEDALRLQNHMYDAVDEIGRVVNREGIDCHYDKSGCVTIARGKYQLQRLRDNYAWYEQLGLAGNGIQWLDMDEARQLVSVSRCQAAIRFPHCAAIHPARLARGLAETLESSGVKIHEHSPVTEIDASPVDGTRIVTPDGSLNSRIVVRATEGFSKSIPSAKWNLIPVHSTMVVTAPLTGEQVRQTGLNHRTPFGDSSHVVTYGQLTADNRIAFGCRGSYYFDSGVRTRFSADEKVFTIVRKTLLQMLPCLEGIEFTHAWGGAFGMSRNRLPTVSFDASSGQGWAGGYSGNGVGASNLAGRTLADLILERDTGKFR
jgi:glycine/D-amino acid oxidase-like deaminating enzyme